MGYLDHAHQNPEEVDFRSTAYVEMAAKWSLLHDLLGGTLAMKQAGQKWLPKEPGEEADDYAVRLDRSVLFNGYGKTIDQLVSKPFEESVTVDGLDELADPTAREFLEMIEGDVDRTGKDLTSFASEALRAALIYGFTTCLVDMPKMGEGSTLGEKREKKLRPTFVHVTAPQILGFRTEKQDDGTERLVMLRYIEEVEIPDGTYGSLRIQRIRVYTPDTWQIWETEGTGVAYLDGARPDGISQNKGPGDDDKVRSKFFLREKGRNALGEIPLVAFYTRREGFLTATPPFEDVARLNVAHWQSTSDHRSYLAFARIGTLGLFGFDPEELGSKIKWGRTRYLYSENTEARAEVVEHAGTAIQAGIQDLDKLEQQMESLGNEPLRERVSGVTATGESRDESRGKSRLHAWVRDAETFLRRCYEWAAKWENTELPEAFAVDIFSDFRLIAGSGGDDFKQLQEMRAEGLLTVRTLLFEAKRRGMLSDRFDVDAELDALVEEADTLPRLGDEGMEEPPPDEGEESDSDESEEEEPQAEA